MNDLSAEPALTEGMRPCLTSPTAASYLVTRQESITDPQTGARHQVWNQSEVRVQVLEVADLPIEVSGLGLHEARFPTLEAVRKTFALDASARIVLDYRGNTAVLACVDALERAREALSLPPPPPPHLMKGRLMPEEIIQSVAQTWGIHTTDLLSDRRARHHTLPRHVAFTLVRRHTGLSFPEIGRWFNKDHSSIQHGVRKIEAEVLVNTSLRKILLRIEEDLGLGPPKALP